MFILLLLNAIVKVKILQTGMKTPSAEYPQRAYISLMRGVEKATLLNSTKCEKLFQISMSIFFGAICALNRSPLPHKEQRIAVMVGKQFIRNILVQCIRAILEDPPHLAA